MESNIRMEMSSESKEVCEWVNLSHFSTAVLETFMHMKMKKIFNVQTIQHFRAIELELTGQILWHIYADFFFCHGMLHLQKKDGSLKYC